MQGDTWSHETVHVCSCLLHTGCLKCARLMSRKTYVVLNCWNLLFKLWRGSTLASKPSADVTRSPKYGYQCTRYQQKVLMSFISREKKLLVKCVQQGAGIIDWLILAINSHFLWLRKLTLAQSPMSQNNGFTFCFRFPVLNFSLIRI